MVMIPKKVFLTKGVGVDKEKLSSFELALRSAGIAALIWFTFHRFFHPIVSSFPKKLG